jgi:serine-type D-Ala-D-Ala carboxypeptidase (penicillin-binding protein 5/6)
MSPKSKSSRLIHVLKRRAKVFYPKLLRELPYAGGILLFIALIFFITSLLPTPASQPSISKFSSLPVSKNITLPYLTAKNIYIYDATENIPLYEKNADSEVFPASTTKMMTALVALDTFSLDQVLSVSRSYPDGENLGFLPGDKLTLENLLYAMLVQSANDAAEIIADNYPGGRSAFVTAMNTKAAQFGLQHTHFQNPTGLDEVGHYSSAADLVRISRQLLKSSELAKIVSTENAVISDKNTGNQHILANINQLLGKVPGVLGIKTGFTDGAGQALVTLVNRQNHPLLIVVLGSTDRFSDTKNLIDWSYSNFTW